MIKNNAKIYKDYIHLCQGNPYEGQIITFNINGVFYNKITDSNGHAKLNINLPAGEYIITSSYNGTNVASKVTVKA